MAPEPLFFAWFSIGMAAALFDCLIMSLVAYLSFAGDAADYMFLALWFCTMLLFTGGKLTRLSSIFEYFSEASNLAGLVLAAVAITEF